MPAASVGVAIGAAAVVAVPKFFPYLANATIFSLFFLVDPPPSRKNPNKLIAFSTTESESDPKEKDRVWTWIRPDAITPHIFVQNSIEILPVTWIRILVCNTIGIW